MLEAVSPGLLSWAFTTAAILSPGQQGRVYKGSPEAQRHRESVHTILWAVKLGPHLYHWAGGGEEVPMCMWAASQVRVVLSEYKGVPYSCISGGPYSYISRGTITI